MSGRAGDVAPIPVDPLPTASIESLAFEDAVKPLVGGRVSRTNADRIAYARDLWPLTTLWLRRGRIPPPPELIVWPGTEAEVLAVVRMAREHRMPLVPYGGGSGLCGGVVPLRGGCTVDTKHLGFVGRVDPRTLEVEVGAGVRGEVLERALVQQGYTLGHFPSSMAMSTVGGWLAVRAVGALSGRYGGIEDVVASVSLVCGRGERVRTAPRPLPGSELTQLLLGSEGALGIFTGARLRVHRVPPHRTFRALRLRSVSDGVELMRQVVQAGLTPSVLRLSDSVDAFLQRQKVSLSRRPPPSLRSTLAADMVPGVLRQLSPRALRSPTAFHRLADRFRSAQLIVCFDGEPERTVADEREVLRRAQAFVAMDLGEAPARAWFDTRHLDNFARSTVFDAGAFTDTMDVGARWDQVLEVYTAVKEAVRDVAVARCQLSHVRSDGCALSFTFLAAEQGTGAPEERYLDLWDQALTAAMRAGANVSHHHGVGLLKRRHFEAQLGTAQPLLSALKRALDPDDLMNPGKWPT